MNASRRSGSQLSDDVLAPPLPRVAAERTIEIFSSDFSDPLRGSCATSAWAGCARSPPRPSPWSR